MKTESLLGMLKTGEIHYKDVSKKITEEFCAENANVQVLLWFFEARLDLENLKCDWLSGTKSEEIDQILQRNTLSQGHGIYKLGSIDALSEVLSEEALGVMKALEDAVNVIFAFRGANDTEFWRNLVNKYRKTKIKEVLAMAIFKLEFSDKQLAKVVGREKFLCYVPAERRERIRSLL